jgi:hypothetical protein
MGADRCLGGHGRVLTRGGHRRLLTRPEAAALLVAAIAAAGGCSSGSSTGQMAQGGTESVLATAGGDSVGPGSGGTQGNVPSGGSGPASAGGTQSVSSGGTQSVSSGGTQSVSTGGTQSVFTGGTQSVPTGGTQSVSTGGTQSVSSGGTQSVSTGGSQSISTGGTQWFVTGGTASQTGGASSTGGTTATGGSGSVTTSCSSVGGGTCPSSFTCHDGSQPGSGMCGCYTVSGLGERKAAVLDSGARQGLDSALVRYMLASAMMETDTYNTSYPAGDGKTGGSSCWGLCKQNWDMIRECHPPWNSLGQNDYNTGAQLNSDLDLDVLVYVECREYYGDKWWAGHRNGWAGLNVDSNTPDIQNFKAAMDWTDRMLEGHECDDVRFWADVQPIIIR